MGADGGALDFRGITARAAALQSARARSLALPPSLRPPSASPTSPREALRLLSRHRWRRWRPRSFSRRRRESCAPEFSRRGRPRLRRRTHQRSGARRSFRALLFRRHGYGSRRAIEAESRRTAAVDSVRDSLARRPVADGGGEELSRSPAPGSGVPPLGIARSRSRFVRVPAETGWQLPGRFAVTGECGWQRGVFDGQQVDLRLRRAGGSGERRRKLGCGSRSARRQGGESRRHDPPRRCRCRPVSPSRPPPATPFSPPAPVFPTASGRRSSAALARLETVTGKRFGDAANPLLVSCRSGARFSMPGMMDTVLNIGLNDEVAAGLEDSPATRASSSTATAVWCRCSARWCWRWPTNRSRRCSPRRARAPEWRSDSGPRCRSLA